MISVVGLVLLALPVKALAVRAASDAEVTEFRTAAREFEDITKCERAVSAQASDSCDWVPRPGYEPVISSARVSTLDESWATAFFEPMPRSPEAGTVVFRRYTEEAFTNGVRETRGIWRLLSIGTDCRPAELEFGMENGSAIHLMPDLAEAMGCPPIVPTKVRCLDKFRSSLLALERPRQCAVAGPADSLFAGWMNNRELTWRDWGDGEGATGLGVVRQVPRALMRRARRPLTTPAPVPAISPAVPLPPFSVRMEASEQVSCGTSYFYSHLHVSSAFGSFAVDLPTCPDLFFAPAP